MCMLSCFVLSKKVLFNLVCVFDPIDIKLDLSSQNPWQQIAPKVEEYPPPVSGTV